MGLPTSPRLGRASRRENGWLGFRRLSYMPRSGEQCENEKGGRGARAKESWRSPCSVARLRQSMVRCTVATVVTTLSKSKPSMEQLTQPTFKWGCEWGGLLSLTVFCLAVHTLIITYGGHSHFFCPFIFPKFGLGMSLICHLFFRKFWQHLPYIKNRLM